MELVREEYLRRVETLLGQSVDLAREGNIPFSEVLEMFRLLYDDHEAN